MVIIQTFDRLFCLQIANSFYLTDIQIFNFIVFWGVTDVVFKCLPSKIPVISIWQPDNRAIAVTWCMGVVACNHCVYFLLFFENTNGIRYFALNSQSLS